VTVKIKLSKQGVQRSRCIMAPEKDRENLLNEGPFMGGEFTVGP